MSINPTKPLVFIKKAGFEIVAEEVIENGNGFVMDDFKMELKI
jgi:hypothetical protein